MFKLAAECLCVLLAILPFAGLHRDLSNWLDRREIEENRRLAREGKSLRRKSV